VRDDVQVARSPGAVNITAPWEILFHAAVVGGTALTLLTNPGEPNSWRAGVVGIGVAMVVWQATVGHRAMSRSGVQPYVSILVVLGLFAIALTRSASEAYVLIGLPALPHVTLANRRAAHALATLTCFVPSIVYLIQSGDLHTTARVMLPSSIAGSIFSALVAMGVERAERRSQERARLIEELTATQAELAEASRRAGIADERQRLAGEIHDTVAQGLSSVVMLVQAAEASLDTDLPAARRHLDLAARTARENLAETRAIVAALTPAPLADASLPEALRRLGERVHDLEIDVEVAGTARTLPMAVEVVLLRAAQEGLANVVKHANARRAAIRLSFSDDRVKLEVRDDGRGFDPETPTVGYGLPTMRGRIEQVGGSLSLRSAPGTGTSLRAEVTA
jgi:signal transduction histidine kinase